VTARAYLLARKEALLSRENRQENSR